MKAAGVEIPQEVVDRVRNSISEQRDPFKLSDVKTWALLAGVPPNVNDLFSNAILQAERRAGKVRFDGRSWRVSQAVEAVEHIQVVILLESGMSRVLEGRSGMTFIVDSFTPGEAGQVAHVRDYRYEGENGRGFQIWSLAADQYRLVSE